MKQVASTYKVAHHRDRLIKYLINEPIFPVTVEMDITSKCTRTCEDCPSCNKLNQKSMSMNFVENLFTSLEKQTKGLLLTGGEPTMSPLFPDVLELAKKQGFEDIAVVTNGSLLNEESVADALLKYASTIRISLYDWDEVSCKGISPTLERIDSLRKQIDKSGSSLKIGISALTSKERAGRLSEIADSVYNSGAHWIYFHPMCIGWAEAKLSQINQHGVLNAVDEYIKRKPQDFDVFIAPERYNTHEISFDRYHTAHFLLVIGADGINYLGAEVKYQDRFAIANLAENWDSNFLRSPERLEKINAVNSRTYTALNSRHRGVLYCDYIDKLEKNHSKLSESNSLDKDIEFMFPYIL